MIKIRCEDADFLKNRYDPGLAKEEKNWDRKIECKKERKENRQTGREDENGELRHGRSVGRNQAETEREEGRQRGRKEERQR